MLALEFDKLLVAIDDSEIADQALRLAIGIALPDSSRLDVLHVVTPSPSTAFEIPSPLSGPSVPPVTPLPADSGQSTPRGFGFKGQVQR